MASTVKIKRSNVAGRIPTTSDITAGELALNTNDGRLYSTDGVKVTEIGANVHSLSVGAGTFSIANGGITFPTSDGGTGQVLQTNGSGTLSFATVSGGISNVVEDTTPQLGGNLDAQSYNITSLGTLNTHTIPGGTDTLVGRLTTDTLQNKTLTDPKIPGYIADSNGNELIKFTTTAGAKNEITITNAATGSDPTIAATGNDTNIDLQLSPKGSGNVLLGNFTFDADQTVGSGQDNYVLTYDDSAGHISLEAASGGGGGGGWEYVSTIEASNSSSISFFSAFSSGYDYKITGQEIKGQNNNTYYYARLELNNSGSTYAGYNAYSLSNIRHLSGSVFATTASSTLYNLTEGLPLGIAAAAQHHNIDLEIINPADQSNYYAPIRYVCWGRRYGNANFGQYGHHFMEYKNQPITGISFFFSSGYHTKGRFKLYRRANV